jgi:hypothetical protein
MKNSKLVKKLWWETANLDPLRGVRGRIREIRVSLYDTELLLARMDAEEREAKRATIRTLQEELDKALKVRQELKRTLRPQKSLRAFARDRLDDPDVGAWAKRKGL